MHFDGTKPLRVYIFNDLKCGFRERECWFAGWKGGLAGLAETRVGAFVLVMAVGSLRLHHGRFPDCGVFPFHDQSRLSLGPRVPSKAVNA